MSRVLAWLSGVKLWLIAGGIGLAFVGVLFWRVFDAGRNEEKIKRVEDAMANIRRGAEARARERSYPTDASKDPYNRDNSPLR